MASGRTKVDEAVGSDAEDLVRGKLHPDTGEQDEAAQKVSREGGTAKLPSNLSPFKLHGG